MARRAVIVDAVRSPFGKGRATGALAPVHPVDLLAVTIEALVQRTGLDPGRVDDVIAGCAIPVGEQAGNIARHAALAAGLPEEVPGTTVDRKCGSSLQALHFAAQGVVAGDLDVVIVGGVDMMGTVPMKANRLGRDDLGPRLRARYPEGLGHQGIAAELIAARWKISRDESDAWALRSHQRAADARRSGFLHRQIVPVTTPDGSVVTLDEGIRTDTTAEALASLPPAFFDEARARRWPEIGWVVTAGSSSPVSDGASAALVVGEDVAGSLGLVPRAAILAGAVVGTDPILMLTGPIPATGKVLARADLRLSDIDLFEVNEAFAPVVLAWLAETHADPDRVNAYGGAIALGHPPGASGCRLLATMLDGLDEVNGRYGLLTLCESGGMANAMVVERLG
ncbi:MAG TPA: thiolase family protein, partial [Acidimicrobiia bacterium]|nr:thiolase family protein [Acidimicrobiia bacterium]